MEEGGHHLTVGSGTYGTFDDNLCTNDCVEGDGHGGGDGDMVTEPCRRRFGTHCYSYRHQEVRRVKNF